MIGATDEQHRPELQNRHALKRFATSEEIAKAFIWLASDDASFVTGCAILVDGGHDTERHRDDHGQDEGVKRELRRDREPTADNAGDGLPIGERSAAELAVDHAPDPLPVLHRKRVVQAEGIADLLILLNADERASLLRAQDCGSGVAGEDTHRAEDEQ